MINALPRKYQHWVHWSNDVEEEYGFCDPVRSSVLEVIDDRSSGEAVERPR
jgi:hypothetical protein